MNRFFSSDTHMGNRNEMSHRYTRIDDFYGSARNLHLIAEVFQGMVFIGSRGGDIALQGGEESSPGWLKMIL